jgi:hypothetical protein
MFTATANGDGWNIYRKGSAKLIATFEKLETIKKMVENIGGNLTVVVGGYAMN